MGFVISLSTGGAQGRVIGSFASGAGHWTPISMAIRPSTMKSKNCASWPEINISWLNQFRITLFAIATRAAERSIDNQKKQSCINFVHRTKAA
jgi:hypothetical protein